MADLILFTSLHQKDNLVQHNLCKLLSTYSKHNVFLYYPNENRSKIWNSIPKIKIWDKPIREIINKTIVVFEYSDMFLELDASNKLILITRGVLTDLDWLLLGKLSGVISPTLAGAYYIASQARTNNIQLSTTNLLPWYDPKNYQVTKQVAGKAATLPFNKLDHAAFAVSDDISNILQLMLSGKPVIVSHQFQELVIDNYNGFIASTPHEVSLATKRMRHANTIELGFRSRQIAEALMDPLSYVAKFEKFIDELPILPLSHTKKSSTDRKWVVTNKAMVGGQIKTIPEIIGKNFVVMEYTNILNVLNFFANQLFAEAYIFGFEFLECSNQEINQLKIITNRMGSRARKLFFCLDEPIPVQWAPVFNNLGILSQAEGLKQVK